MFSRLKICNDIDKEYRYPVGQKFSKQQQLVCLKFVFCSQSDKLELMMVMLMVMSGDNDEDDKHNVNSRNTTQHSQSIWVGRL